MTPPAYPVSVPSAPTTRWHGITIGIGLRPLAIPTARDPCPVIPSRPAISPYVAVRPHAIVVSWSHTVSWNGVPCGRTGTSNTLSSLAK